MNGSKTGRRVRFMLLAALLGLIIIGASSRLLGRPRPPQQEDLPIAAAIASPAGQPLPTQTAAPATGDAPLGVRQEICPDQGAILLWHGLDPQESAVLEEIAGNFAALCPEIRVDLEGIDHGQLLGRFESASAAGGGPDLILAPGQWTGRLVEAGLVHELSDLLAPEILQQFLPAALEALSYRGGLYGLPGSVQTVVLYYNRELVSDLPATLDDLLAQGAAGKATALNISFYHAYWGIPAFGGQLFDEEGRVILDQGGFARWLAWLQTAQAAPGLVLDIDSARLKALFEAGAAAYYVDGPWALADLQKALGAEQVGVAPLPAGPAGPAGPLLSVEGYLINSAANDAQVRLALAFAQYATSTEAQTLLMARLDQIPANAAVDASRRPVIAGFLTQALMAIPMPNMREMDVVWRAGNDAYTRVLSGLASPIEAAVEATQQINQANGKP